MRIKEMISQHRRDFMAVYECESCGATVTMSGYDDAYFHQAVIPAMGCGKCGSVSNEVTSAASVPADLVI